MSYIDGMRDVFQAKLDHLNTMDTLKTMRDGKNASAAPAPTHVRSEKSGGWVMAIAVSNISGKAQQDRKRAKK